MSFEPIRRIIPQAVQAAGISRQVTAARVIEGARETCLRLWGEERARYVEIVSFREGELKIAALAPVALQELKIHHIRVQNEINRLLGSKAVHAIKFISRNF